MLAHSQEALGSGGEHFIQNGPLDEPFEGDFDPLFPSGNPGQPTQDGELMLLLAGRLPLRVQGGLDPLDPLLIRQDSSEGSPALCTPGHRPIKGSLESAEVGGGSLPAWARARWYRSSAAARASLWVRISCSSASWAPWD